MAVDFHVTPKAGDNGDWSAAGHYYNDNGTVLNLAGNGNFYVLQVSGGNTTGSAVVAQNFTVTITTSTVATNYLNATTSCSATNANDFFGNITIYNANKFNLNTTLAVYAISQGNVNTTVGIATYNATSERLVSNITVPLCLSSLSYISFEVPYVAPKLELLQE